MEQASAHISALVSTVSVSQNRQDGEQHSVTLTFRQKVADPSDKRHSNMQLTRQKRRFMHNVYTDVLFEVIRDISRTFHVRSTSRFAVNIIMYFETVRAAPPQMPQEGPPAAPKEGPSFVEQGMEAKSMSGEESKN